MIIAYNKADNNPLLEHHHPVSNHIFARSGPILYESNGMALSACYKKNWGRNVAKRSPFSEVSQTADG